MDKGGRGVPRPHKELQEMDSQMLLTPLWTDKLTAASTDSTAIARHANNCSVSNKHTRQLDCMICNMVKEH